MKEGAMPFPASTELFPAPITIELRFVIDGVPYPCAWRPEIPAGASRALTELELFDGEHAPVMRTPFTQHGTRLHSICSLDNPNTIDRVEW